MLAVATASTVVNLRVGAKIYYEGTLLANPKVLRSTKLDRQEVEEVEEEDIDIFEVDADA